MAKAPELPQEQSSDQKDGVGGKPIADALAQLDSRDVVQVLETMPTEAPATTDISKSLLELKGAIETATCYEEELSELLERCHATVEQFEEHPVAQKEAELQELLRLIDDAKDVAKLCNEDSPFWRVGHHFKISNELRSLEARTISREVVDVKPNTVRRHPPGAKLPVGAPRIHAWHIERTEIIDAVCDQLGASSRYGGANERPRMVGITGLAGSGKSTVVSMVIARESVRASFTKGVLWLPAGPGAKERLPLLMYRLAKMVYEAVNGWKGKAPRAPDVGIDPEDGAAYVRETVGSYHYRLLIVADDVWDEDVLKELMSSGVSILYTTRLDQLLGDTPIRLEKVDIQEGEILLRGAAELGDTVNLPNDAHELVKRCGSSIMDLAFIGRWNVVRGRKYERGWQKAVDIVVRAQKEKEGETNLSWSAAVLKAGLNELSRDKQIRVLYLSMAILPKGFAFALEDAAALLYDGCWPEEILEDVRQNVTTLENMAIVAQQVGGLYRMHVSHAEFVQKEITKFPKIHERARMRWREYVSTISVLLSWPNGDLVDVCRALGVPDNDAGASVFDAAVDKLSQSDPRFPRALRRLAYIQWVEGNREAACQRWTKLLEMEIQKNKQLVLEYPDLALSLHGIGAYQESLGHVNEAKTWLERALSIGKKQLGSDHPHIADTLHSLAQCSYRIGHTKNAEAFYRRALAIRESKLDNDHLDVAYTLDGLGVCMLTLEKSQEAKRLLDRALTIYKNKLGAYHSEVGRVLYDLGRCASIDGRVEDAERFYRGALDIQKSDETTDGTLADTLHVLGKCVYEVGSIEEAEGLHRRALVIRERNLPPDHPDVARVAYALGKCTLELGKTEEADELCRRALVAIQEPLGNEHPAVADILHTLGICAIVEERTASGTDLLKRALSIYQQQPSIDDSKVAHVTYDLGRCTLMAGHTEEAERFFRKTLEFEESLGADRLEVATVSYALGGCVMMGGRLEKAEDLYRRALEIRVETLGTKHTEVADTLNALANCVLLAGGRAIEAETLFRQALDIKKEVLIPDDPEIQDINHALEMCQIEYNEVVEIDI